MKYYYVELIKKKQIGVTVAPVDREFRLFSMMEISIDDLAESKYKNLREIHREWLSPSIFQYFENRL